MSDPIKQKTRATHTYVDAPQEHFDRFVTNA